MKKLTTAGATTLDRTDFVTGLTRAVVDTTRPAVVATYLLAGGVCLSVTLLTGVLSALPVPVSDRTATVPLFVGLPLALGLAVVARGAVTRTPADTVLAAFAAPVLLATSWTLRGYLLPGAGVSLGNLVSLGTGLLLAVVLLADGVITYVAVPERV